MDKRRYSDRREYLIAAVRNRRKKIRMMAIEYMGGKCQVCGYDRCEEVMEFHHLNSAQKDFGISEKGYTRGWKAVRKELDKCLMLCANCHREVHAGMLQLPEVIRVEKVGEFREIRSGTRRTILSQAPAKSRGRCRDYPFTGVLSAKGGAEAPTIR